MITSDLRKFSFMVVMGQKPDYGRLKSEWREEGSKSQWFGDHWKENRIKEKEDLKEEIGMLIDIGQSPGQRGPLEIQERAVMFSPLCIYTCFKIIAPSLNCSFARK